MELFEALVVCAQLQHAPCHLEYPGHGVGLDPHPVPHEEDDVPGPALVPPLLQHPPQLRRALPVPVQYVGTWFP